LAEKEADADGSDRAEEASRPEPKPLTLEERRGRAVKQKLAEALRDLDKKLDEKGNYARGAVIVQDGKVQVAIYLREMSDEAMAQLKKLGFARILEAPAAKMVLGSIEVGKLADAAMLDAVRLIDVPKLAD